ncbi:TPA: biotin transporter BioY [Candidatus Bipolaricaulota bacterium]|nr:biotin transporter BioY [Candidatus Bipolaricaulota bacterium]
MTIVDAALAAQGWKAREGWKAKVYEAGLVVGGSLLIALSARLVVPLPFSPVPITGQTFGVLLVGALLGGWRGGLSVFLYLLQGLAGLPVFAGGATGLARFAGPTGGYLMGFLPAAVVVGILAQRGWDRKVWTTAVAMGVGNALIYAFGLPWLARFVGPERALPLGLAPFIPGDLVKLALAALALPAGWRFLRWLGRA